MDRQLKKLTKFMEKYCRKRNLTLLSSGAERHGSLEWGTRCGDGLITRYVTLFLTPGIEIVGTPIPYEVTVEAGADTEKHYTRHLVSVFRISASDLGAKPFHKRIEKDLDAALQHAQSLTESDLIESYLQPRQVDVIFPKNGVKHRSLFFNFRSPKRQTRYKETLFCGHKTGSNVLHYPAQKITIF